MTQPPTLVPYLSYVDAKAAMTFLQAAFDFATIQAFDDENGRLVHGEMKYEGAIIMLGSADARHTGSSPGLYIVVDDLDAHFARARDAGADIVYPPEDTEFGTRRYRCRDPEGHEWSFGTYRPQFEALAWS
ncbi:Glyoxalase-like domain protein [Rhodobacteraceae bacterium THAF1]|uniref:VOC family protein n=1 Tax=Palleronia sp. THAF1 TaxID=2587842 RepID=UPI000F4196ED|nr:VOC family protein [Palleronia sp. THAF1]QFU09557.1 Glyoxalase-like domain protein [Palleronia sp. THAF1]VDC20078.1 Glyoxalase-like domain protein [Rhodobacteraceae bacterium THAF1]